MTDEEKFLIDTARQLGLGHMMLPYRHSVRLTTKELALELYWRIRVAIRGWFAVTRKPATKPDVAEMRALLGRDKSLPAPKPTDWRRWRRINAGHPALAFLDTHRASVAHIDQTQSELSAADMEAVS